MRTTRVPVVVAFFGLVALGSAVVPASGAWAIAPACEREVEASPQIEELPWAQRMYDPANKLWPFSKGDGVTVAVLDTGVDATHRQLEDRVEPGYDALGLAAGNADCVPHGTAVASIIAAQQVPGIGFAGLAPLARILPVRVSDKIQSSPADEPLSPAALTVGIDYAVANGADVIAVTAVAYADDQGLEDAVGRAVAAGVIVVAAAGDGHDNDLGPLRPSRNLPYPAIYDGVIGVGAVGLDGIRAQSSQIGSYVDLVAPGLDVTAAAIGGHASYNGTSIATGFVAAAAALMLGQRGSDLAGLGGGDLVDVVTARLLATADGRAGATPSLSYGAGLVDPYRAMTESMANDPPQEIEGPQPPPRDEAALRLAADRAAANGSALRGTLLLIGLAAVVVAASFIIPRGRRRRWRAGREHERTPDLEDRHPEFLPGEMLFRSSATRAGQD